MARRERSRLPAGQRREQIIAAATALVAERGFWGLSMQDVADECGLTVPGLLHHVGSKDGLLVAVLEHRDAEDARSVGEPHRRDAGAAQVGEPHPRDPGAAQVGEPHPRDPGAAQVGEPHPRDPGAAQVGEPHPRDPGAAQVGEPHPRDPGAAQVGEPHPRDLRELCAALVRRNAGQPEIVRLFAVLAAESLAPDHPAHDYFAARQRTVLDSLAALAAPVCADPEALAHQIMATMDGLQLQWLRDPAGTDLVAMWRAAAERLFAGLSG
ncbi:TetR family transcriptional regulator [Dactylosporangium sp. McL0621]|uniref:TetR/AcrR family transcriptional regulator n=1 Tax=Dactylosporangium sp. McL0621 TaxID=3415678 RepID=UPI003CF0FE3B